MGTAILAAGVDRAAGLARNWAEAQGLRLAELPDANRVAAMSSPAGLMVLRGTSPRAVARWSFEEGAHGTVVRMLVTPPWYASVCAFLLMFGGGTLIVQWLSEPSIEGGLWTLARVTAGSLTALAGAAWVMRCVPRLTRLERSFWDEVSRECGVKLVTKVGGRLAPGGWQLLPCLGLLLFAAYLGGAFGPLGAAWAVLFVGPVCFVALLQTWLEDAPRWHWRLWVVGNVGRWSTVCNATLLAVGVLLAVEAMMAVLGDHGYRLPDGRSRLVRWGQFRVVQGATGRALEEDARRRIRELGVVGASRLAERGRRGFTPGKLQVLFSAMCLGLLLTGTACLYVISMVRVLRSASQWREEVVGDAWAKGPSVPPERGAEGRGGRWLASAVLTHFFLAGTVNVAIGLFSLEGAWHAAGGRWLLVPGIAHLWSWVFAWSAELFGPGLGRPFAVVTVAVVSAPFLMCCVLTLGRVWKLLSGCVRAWRERLPAEGRGAAKLLALRTAMRSMCSRRGIGVPRLVSNASSNVWAAARWIPLAGGGGAVELSSGVLDLLGPEELEAVAGHELGHLKQGGFWVGMAKALSMLALFPCYYLTLCFDWARREMVADELALELTHDPSP